jgi:pimeloyl-ACP methyl ester carboxylesterase
MVAEAGEIIRLNGIDLYARGFGDPDLPVLIVAHGGPTWDHSYLLPAVAELADIRHVITPDLRGNGRSGRHLAPEQLQVGYVVDDLLALAAHAGAARFDLLGFSFGASIAMAFAGRYPQALRSVVIASGCAYDVDLDALLEQDPDHRARRALCPGPDAAALAGGPDGALSRAMAHACVPLNVWNRGRWDDFHATLDRVVFSDDWYRAFEAGVVRRSDRADPAGNLRASGVPVLILHGEHEMSFPLGLARRLHADVPGSTLAVVPGAAHMAHVDNPDAWVGAVRDFLTTRSRP